MLGEIRNKKILAISPHPDDLEIGCFGTLARLCKENKIFLLILTKGEQKDPENIRETEALAPAKMIDAELSFCYFKDGFIKEDLSCVQILEDHISRIKPDLVLTINGNDTNQDHRNCFNATISATRKDANVLIYDSGSSKSFSPNLFVDITEFIDLKVKSLLNHRTQFDKRIEEPIKGQAKLYAFKLRKPEKYFEAFEVWKWIA